MKSKMAALTINQQSANRIKSLLEDPSYKEAIEQSSTYNTRLCIERRMRLPFLDSQTGVAQSHCYLWMNRRQRMPGQFPGQLYMYPSKRWRKKRRQYLLNERVYPNDAPEEETNPEPDVHQINMVENINLPKPETQPNEEIGNERLAALLSGGTVDETSKESWYKDYEDASEPPDAGEIEDQDSDFEDYEETYVKKKKKKAPNKPPSTRGRGRRIERNPDGTEVEKPFCCEVCGTRYKTRPGLSYHYSHSHCGTGGTPSSSSSHHAVANPSSGLVESQREMSHQSSLHSDASNPRFPFSQPQAPGMSQSNPAPPASNLQSPANPSQTTVSQPETSEPPVPSTTTQSAQQNPATSADDPLAGLRKFQDSFLTFLKNPGSGTDREQLKSQRSASGKPLANPSPYCDFCLGDHSENKKTGRSEELVSCADCGRSGHPSCLQFTTNMVASVKKYRWQCIECKSCGLCGTSDNDEQLLFCDDCDRGYHMYCLNPPISEPPEGSWSCHLCIEEFGKK